MKGVELLQGRPGGKGRQDDPQIAPRGTPEVLIGAQEVFKINPQNDPKIDPKSSRIRDSQSGSNITPVMVSELDKP